MSVMVVNPYRFGSRKREFDYLGFDEESTYLATHTFPVDIGDPDPNRMIVVTAVSYVLASNPNMRTLQTATIGGYSASVLTAARAEVSLDEWVEVAIVAGFVPGGTNVNVVLNYDDITLCHVNMYRILGASSVAPHDSVSVFQGPDVTRSVSIDVVDQGFLIATDFSHPENDVDTTGVSVDFDSDSWRLTKRLIAGHYDVTATEANRTVSFTRTDAGTKFGITAAVSFS